MKTNLITKSKSFTNPEYGCKPEERPIEDYISKGVINLDKSMAKTFQRFIFFNLFGFK